MPSMINPMSALLQFQEASAAGVIPVQAGRLDPAILIAGDQPNGRQRFNCMRAQGGTLTVLVMFAQNGLEEGHPVFNIGYAVSTDHRNAGLAKSTLVAALAELSSGLASAGLAAIHVEAVISPGNLASHEVARAIFDADPRPIVDSESGEPGLLCTRLVACAR